MYIDNSYINKISDDDLPFLVQKFNDDFKNEIITYCRMKHIMSGGQYERFTEKLKYDFNSSLLHGCYLFK